MPAHMALTLAPQANLLAVAVRTLLEPVGGRVRDRVSVQALFRTVPPVPTTLHHVLRVVGHGSQLQVFRVGARRIIALMPVDETHWDQSVVRSEERRGGIS